MPMPADCPEGRGSGLHLHCNLEQAMLENAAAAKQQFGEIMVQIQDTAFVVNPHTSKHHEDMFWAHQDILETFHPEIAEAKTLWHSSTVEKYCEAVIIYRVCPLHFLLEFSDCAEIEYARGRDGGPIKSRTAMGWFADYLYCICTYTWHPTMGELDGLSILRHGVYIQLENRVKWGEHLLV
jgi:hypothetical protein